MATIEKFITVIELNSEQAKKEIADLTAKTDQLKKEQLCSSINNYRVVAAVWLPTDSELYCSICARHRIQVGSHVCQEP